MKSRQKYQKRGFIKMIIIIVGALVLLKYFFEVDVIGYLTQGKFKELLDQLYGLVVKGWDYFVGLIKKLIAKAR